MFKYFNLFILFFVFISACDPGFDHDIVIRNGTIVDGSGAHRFQGDIAINGNSISSVGSVNGIGKKKLMLLEKLLPQGSLIRTVTMIGASLKNRLHLLL